MCDNLRTGSLLRMHRHSTWLAAHAQPLPHASRLYMPLTSKTQMRASLHTYCQLDIVLPRTHGIVGFLQMPVSVSYNRCHQPSLGCPPTPLFSNFFVLKLGAFLSPQPYARRNKGKKKKRRKNLSSRSLHLSDVRPSRSSSSSSTPAAVHSRRTFQSPIVIATTVSEVKFSLSLSLYIRFSFPFYPRFSPPHSNLHCRRSLVAVVTPRRHVPPWVISSVQQSDSRFNWFSFNPINLESIYPPRFGVRSQFSIILDTVQQLIEFSLVSFHGNDHP